MAKIREGRDENEEKGGGSLLTFAFSFVETALCIVTRGVALVIGGIIRRAASRAGLNRGPVVFCVSEDVRLDQVRKVEEHAGDDPAIFEHSEEMELNDVKVPVSELSDVDLHDVVRVEEGRNVRLVKPEHEVRVDVRLDPALRRRVKVRRPDVERQVRRRRVDHSDGLVNARVHAAFEPAEPHEPQSFECFEGRWARRTALVADQWQPRAVLFRPYLRNELESWVLDS